MFGIGFSELIIIGVILIVAVGPKRMPGMLKAVVRAYQEFRRATRELRASTGIDELLQDEDLKSLRKPLHVPPPKSLLARGGPRDKAAASKRTLSAAEREREAPSEGVDIAEAREAERRPSAEEGERIRAAKMAAAPIDDDEAGERIRAAKMAAMPRDDEEGDRIRAAKMAAMPRDEDDEAGERIRAAKTAAAARRAHADGEE
jgi:sec-independent protein translocase protein TatB